MSFIQPYYGYQQQPFYTNYIPQQQFPMQQQVATQNPQPQISQSQNNTISCEYVDNFEVVNAKNCDFSGKPMLYMKTDGSAIYRKQLNIETGKSKTYTYELRDEINEKSGNTDITNITGVINSQIESLRQEFSKNIGDLKEMVMNLNITSNDNTDSAEKTITTNSTRKVVNK